MFASAGLLRDARRQAGLTQADLARRLGVSQAAVAKLERPGANPTLQTLDDALRATGHRLTLDAPKWRSSVDESLIRQQLELPPAERIRQLDQQVIEMRALVEAGARTRGELS
jgi:transcriptional regulator with XRE-family HTH domain